MANTAILAIKIVADARAAQKGLEESGAATSKWSAGLSKASAVATVGLAAVAGVMIAGVKAAAEDEQAQAVLAKTLHNSAGATDAVVASTEDWITKTALATGVADDQLRPALGALVRATGDVATAQDGMALALDISAATGKDVQAVSEGLAKGYAGNTAALGRLVPGLDKAVLASGDMSKITAELSAQVGGSAAAAADTAAGQYQIFTVAMDETKESIGAALLPALSALAEHMAGIAKWASENSKLVLILIGVFTGAAAVIVTLNAVTKAMAIAEIALGIATAETTGLTIAGRIALIAKTAVEKTAAVASKALAAAQWLINAAMTANPIGLVIAAIALLVAGLVLAYNKSETFREIVNGAFRAVANVAEASFDAVTGAARACWSWISSTWNRLRDILTTPFEVAWSVISGIINKIKDAVGSITSLIDHIPTPKIPHIPGLNATTATGGYAAPAVSGLAAGRAPATRATGTATAGTTIVVQGALDPEGVARQIRKILGGHDVRMGRAALVSGAL